MNNCLHKRVAMVPVFMLIGLLLMSNAWSATLVVANKAEATVSLIDLNSGRVAATLATNDGPHEVDVSADGRFALVTNYGSGGQSGNSLTLIDVVNAKVAKTIDLGEYKAPHGVEWVDDGRAAVTVEDNQALIIVDVENGEIVQAIGTDQQVSHMVALDPDGRRAYTANIGSGSISVLDLVSGERVKNVVTGDGAEGVAVSSMGHVWVTNRAADTVTVLSGETYTILKEIASPGFPLRATTTPKDQVLVTRASAGELVIYDADTFSEVQTVAFDINSMGAEGRLFGDRFGDSSVPIGVVVDETGEHAYVAHANADVITEVDLSNGDVVRLLRAGREPDGMAYSALSPKRD